MGRVGGSAFSGWLAFEEKSGRAGSSEPAPSCRGGASEGGWNCRGGSGVAAGVGAAALGRGARTGASRGASRNGASKSASPTCQSPPIRSFAISCPATSCPAILSADAIGISGPAWSSLKSNLRFSPGEDSSSRNGFENSSSVEGLRSSDCETGAAADGDGDALSVCFGAVALFFGNAGEGLVGPKSATHWDRDSAPDFPPNAVGGSGCRTRGVRDAAGKPVPAPPAARGSCVNT